MLDKDTIKITEEEYDIEIIKDTLQRLFEYFEKGIFTLNVNDSDSQYEEIHNYVWIDLPKVLEQVYMLVEQCARKEEELKQAMAVQDTYKALYSVKKEYK